MAVSMLILLLMQAALPCLLREEMSMTSNFVFVIHRQDLPYLHHQITRRSLPLRRRRGSEGVREATGAFSFASTTPFEVSSYAAAAGVLCHNNNDRAVGRLPGLEWELVLRSPFSLLAV